MARPMRRWEWSVVVVSVLVSGCFMGPSEEQLQCYQGCAREKDSCMLSASTAQQIQACDARGSQCSAVCQ